MPVRDGKPAEAIAPLKSALALRGEDRPPVEELLLALAFADMKQPDEARRWLGVASAWIDRYRQPLQIASALGCAPSGPLFAATEMVKTPLDPRYNPFDWETWYELELFRMEAEGRLASR
jgi:hypothetical protein